MQLGKLDFSPANQALTLLGAPVQAHLQNTDVTDRVWVSRIDPALADTAAFCRHYEIGLDLSANCVIVEAARAGRRWYAACIILATTHADINGVIRRHLEARKISFAAMDATISLTHMEYGGITPIGLPDDWPILIDDQIIKQPQVVIGSGIRSSKILVSTAYLASLPNATVMAIRKTV